MEELCIMDKSPVSWSQGNDVARQINAMGYFETSALNNDGVREAFEAAARFSLMVKLLLLAKSVVCYF